MSWVGAAIVTASTVYQTHEQKKAQKRARKDAIDAEKQARKSAVFAETEGEGTGQLGQISLELDDELDEDELEQSNVSSVLRI